MEIIMNNNTNNKKVLKRLRTIFAENTDKRICVVGVSCTGKSTLLRDLPECLDGDNIVWDTLPEDVYKRLSCSPTPWDEETLNIWKEWYIKTDFDIKPGQPLFSVWVEDCDLVVYLTLSENEYLKRVAMRGRNLEDMLKQRQELDKVVRECNLPVIIVKL